MYIICRTRKDGAPVKITVLAARAPRFFTREEEEGLLALMPDERRRRLSDGGAPLRPETLCAWALLRTAIGADALPPMFRTESGKPYFEGGPFFSLSHTDGAALCAVSDAEVGADIERVRSVAGKLQERMGARDGDEFIRLWVRRESRAKFLGSGVFSMPMRFSDDGRDGTFYRLALLDGFESGVFCAGAAEINTEVVDIKKQLRL
jgi:hypothetical protein